MNDNELLAAALLRTPEGQQKVAALQLKNSQSGAAKALTPTFQRGNPVTTIGGQSIGGVNEVDTGLLETITINYEAPTSSGKWLIIGNPGNIISGRLGIDAKDIADFGGNGSTNSYEELKEFARQGFTIATVNYQVSTSSQFAQALKSASTALDGTVVTKPLGGRLVASLNPMDNLQNVRILDFSNGQQLINTNNALVLWVAAGNEVTLAITPGGART